MAEDVTTIQDLLDLAKTQAFAFVRRPVHDARTTQPSSEQPTLQREDIIASLPQLITSAQYTLKTHHLYLTGVGATDVNGLQRRLSHLDKALDNVSTPQGRPVPELTRACHYLDVAADLVRTTMPFASTGPDSVRNHAMDTVTADVGDVLHTLTGAIHAKLERGEQYRQSRTFLRAIDSVVEGTAHLRNLALDPDHRQIAELGIASAHSAGAHAALRRWLAEAAPTLGTRTENLTGATRHIDWRNIRQRPAKSEATHQAQFDARGSSYMLRGITQTGMVLNRSGMQIVKFLHHHGHLTRTEAASALDTMNQAGAAWTTAARIWDSEIKVAGAQPGIGTQYIEPALRATQHLNATLRPLATGDQDALRTLATTRRDLQRCIGLVQHLDATLDRLAFAHRRLVDRLADSGQLLGSHKIHIKAYLTTLNRGTTWTPVTSSDTRVQTLVAAAHSLTDKAQASTEATSRLRMDAPTKRTKITQQPEPLKTPRHSHDRPQSAGSIER